MNNKILFNLIFLIYAYFGLLTQIHFLNESFIFAFAFIRRYAFVCLRISVKTETYVLLFSAYFNVIMIV